MVRKEWCKFAYIFWFLCHNLCTSFFWVFVRLRCRNWIVAFTFFWIFFSMSNCCFHSHGYSWHEFKNCSENGCSDSNSLHGSNCFDCSASDLFTCAWIFVWFDIYCGMFVSMHWKSCFRMRFHELKTGFKLWDISDENYQLTVCKVIRFIVDLHVCITYGITTLLSNCCDDWQDKFL